MTLVLSVPLNVSTLVGTTCEILVGLTSFEKAFTKSFFDNSTAEKSDILRSVNCLVCLIKDEKSHLQ